MLYQIFDGTVSAGGKTILSHINFEIKDREKIAVVGKNGAGKTTLLRLIAGELELDRDDRRPGPGIASSRRLVIGMLSQQNSIKTASRTVEEEILSAGPCEDLFSRERFDYEREYDKLFTGFGFNKEDKGRLLSEFSGGEQTKIALIRLLLLKPDILLLDEPTNHLDLETYQWLERCLNQYEKAVVMVSHDRFFLDQTAQIVYELSGSTLTRYPGNYSDYRKQRKKNLEIQKKAYERQQEERKRLEDLIERFKHKPSKAAFARSRKKILERMPQMIKPEDTAASIFTGDITPLVLGSKWVYEAEHLKIGYERTLLELSLRIKRGQKIGIVGANGAGKTTFLKTVAGFLPAVDGEQSLGLNTMMGYFDQHSADLQSENTVKDHFHNLFPVLTEKEVRGVLGAYLFGGKEAAKPVSSLSGGEKSRLVLAELLQSRPNFLILDEPTNHMDIEAREVLEAAFQSYTGTILFVSHDRYFISEVADAVLIFEEHSVMYYPFGYRHYTERMRKNSSGLEPAARVKAEEQALIAGIRAVPKAERHRLKEIPEEEAYADWQLRLVGERLDSVRERAEELACRVSEMEEEWHNSEECFMGLTWVRQREYEELVERYEAVCSQWTDCCLDWFDRCRR